MNEARSGFGPGQGQQGNAAGTHAPAHPTPHAPMHPAPHAPPHGAPHPASPPPFRPQTIIPQALQRQTAPDEEPLELVDDQPVEQAKSKIHGVSAGPAHIVGEYKRGTHKNQTGAVRVRSFHCRLSEQGLEYMDHAINDWLDRHPDIEIKFTSSTVGPFDGKIKEPALILNLWY